MLNSLLISESFGPTPNTFRSDDFCLLLSNFIVKIGEKQNQSANYKNLFREIYFVITASSVLIQIESYSIL